MGSGKELQDKHFKQPSEKSGAPAAGQAPKPEWADGLRKMYDSVVDEPLPDSFKDLLSKLDEAESGGKS
ncbi:NepR family anti-sigma factor [Erythrobacter sp. HA6-11]